MTKDERIKKLKREIKIITREVINRRGLGPDDARLWKYRSKLEGEVSRLTTNRRAVNYLYSAYSDGASVKDLIELAQSVFGMNWIAARRHTAAAIEKFEGREVVF